MQTQTFSKHGILAMAKAGEVRFLTFLPKISIFGGKTLFFSPIGGKQICRGPPPGGPKMRPEDITRPKISGNFRNFEKPDFGAFWAFLPRLFAGDWGKRRFLPKTQKSIFGSPSKPGCFSIFCFFENYGYLGISKSQLFGEECIFFRTQHFHTGTGAVMQKRGKKIGNK